MSTSIVHTEPELTDGNVTDADELLIADNSDGGRPKRAGVDTLRTTLSGALVTVTSATVTITRAAHAGRTVSLAKVGGIAVTLPAATGSGDRYRFIVKITFTSDGTIKVVANDTMIGTCILFADGGATVVGFAASGSDDTITLDGADTGGILGCIIELKDIAADLWHVEMVSDATGTEVTPFSDTVS